MNGTIIGTLIIFGILVPAGGFVLVKLSLNVVLETFAAPKTSVTNRIERILAQFTFTLLSVVGVFGIISGVLLWVSVITGKI